MKPSLESSTSAPPVALLTMGQVAQRMSVSKRTVLRWIETSLLPATRVGQSSGSSRMIWNSSSLSIKCRSRNRPSQRRPPTPITGNHRRHEENSPD
jgi:excisionase family DNA binding protein